MNNPNTSSPVSIFISVDEWRDIATWMHVKPRPHGEFAPRPLPARVRGLQTYVGHQ